MVANLTQERTEYDVESEQQTRWNTLVQADRMLLMLNRQQQAEHYGKLREYVRWLLTEQSDESARLEFEEEREALERRLKEQVNMGMMSGVLAKQKRGDWLWQKAIELSRHMIVFFTVYQAIEAGTIEQFKCDLAAARRAIYKHQQHTEREQAEQLRQVLPDPFEPPK